MTDTQNQLAGTYYTENTDYAIASDVDKIHIDNQGFLSLVRKGRTVLSLCPYASSNMTIKCGDWCPMFGEPMLAGGDSYMLQLYCANTSRIILGKLEDDR